MAPRHEIWQRHRRRHHGGAIRAYAKPPSPQYGRTSPAHCKHCSSTFSSEREGEGEGERGGGEQCDDGTVVIEEDPVPKFDLLDEIDLSDGQVESEFRNNALHMYNVYVRTCTYIQCHVYGHVHMYIYTHLIVPSELLQPG